MKVRGFRGIAMNCGILLVLAAASLVLIQCNSSSPASGMGAASVSMTDPPSCGNYSHVYVTIDEVSANISSTSDSGWQSLVSQLSSTSSPVKAVQVDLLNLPASGQCLIAQLGSNTSLPAGDYQQIRLMLVANGTTGVTLISPSGESTTNQCGGSTWNCVVVSGSTTPTPLDLSSEAQTGLKIPPGQVMGGPISVAAGKSVDINLDFNACRSVLQEGGGQFRLKPTLVAYQTSQNLTGLSGQVVQGTVVTNALTVTTNPIANASVALEMTAPPTDSTNSVDIIGSFLRQTDSSGNFDFCPLPTGPFDVVADAGAGGAATGNYNATIVTGVPNGTQVTVPLLAETGAPATLGGPVNATAANSTATAVSADLYALQTATSSLEFAVPLLTSSTPAIAQLNLPCTSGNCTANYSLVVPASNPLVGAFSAGKITWSLPSTTVAPGYKVEATCTASSGTVGVFSSSQTVTAATTTTVTPALATLAGCQ